MNLRLLSFVIPIFAIAQCAAIATWAAKRADRAQAALSVALTHKAAAAVEVRRHQAAAAAAESECARLKAAIARAKQTMGSTARQVNPPMAYRSINERLQKEPRTQMVFMAFMRAQNNASYGALFRQLHLTPGQIEKFQDILARNTEQTMDADAVMGMQGLSPKDPVAVKTQTDIDAACNEAEKALLGPAGYAQTQAYERTAPARLIVNDYAGGAVVVAREPFTPQQGEELVSTIANASESYRKGGSVDVSEIDWTAVETNARTFLTAAQVEFLKTMEPPLPRGGRYQTQLYRWVDQARKEEAPAAASGLQPPPSG